MTMNQTFFVTDLNSSTGTYGYSPMALTSSYVTDSGTEAGIKVAQNKLTKEISPSLYIKFVKSKLGKVQQDKVKRRLAKLQKLVAYSDEMKQQALYEELTREVAILVRESEIAAFNIDSFVDIEHINKFRAVVKEKVIKWEQLENFPRVIPRSVQTKVKALKKANMFDELWILFIDYTKTEIKTNKEKIRQKDPILFGRFKYQPNRYYFIADWVDDYCDLTLDKFVDKIKTSDPEFSLDKIPDIDKDRWDNIVREVQLRTKRLEETNYGNYKSNMSEEDMLKQARAEVSTKKTSWLRNSLNKITSKKSL